MTSRWMSVSPLDLGVCVHRSGLCLGLAAFQISVPHRVTLEEPPYKSVSKANFTNSIPMRCEEGLIGGISQCTVPHTRVCAHHRK